MTNLSDGSILDQVHEWSGELTATRFDVETGTHFIIRIDSTRRGPAAGGTRAAHYPSVLEAMADAADLASAMTLKMAISDLPMGGGKSVIALPRPRSELSPAQWTRILELHGDNIEKLRGSYWTGPDVNTNSADMDVIAQRTSHVFGRSPENGGAGSSAHNTALGVFTSIETTLAWQGRDLAGRTIVVQGLGAVGLDLAAMLFDAGATVIVCDRDQVRSAIAERLGYKVIRVEEALSTPCDVFAPCAMGGVIDRNVAASIPAGAIVGAANNPVTDEHAEAILMRRGIQYAPDFVANAGGALHLVGREVLGWSEGAVQQAVRGIGKTLTEVFELSASLDNAPPAAARQIARQRVESVPAPRRG